MRIASGAPILGLLMTLCVVPAAHAQDQRLRVAFGPAAATGVGDGTLALTGSIGYRFSERFSFDVDLTTIDGAADRFSDREFGVGDAFAGTARTGDLMANLSPLFGGARPGGQGGRMFGGDWRALAGLGAGGFPRHLGGFRATADGRTTIGTAGFRYELPIQGGRLRPYVGGGLGLVRTEEIFRASAAGLSGTVSDALLRAGVTPPAGFSLGIDSLSESVSHVGVAVGAGVGASLRVFRELSVDIDTRYFRLAQGRNVARFGGGISYRF